MTWQQAAGAVGTAVGGPIGGAIGTFAGGLLGGKGKKKPKSPDYVELAKQQGIEDRKTAQEITRWNRPQQYDAMGNSLTWEEDPTGKWTQKQTWTPDVQNQFKSQIRNANSAAGLQAQMMGRLSSQGQFEAPDMPTYDPNSGKAVSDATYELMMGRVRPEQQHSEEMLTNKLRLQGLQPGTEAFDRAMRNMLTAHGDVNTQAAQAATVAGYGEARDRYLAQLKGQGQDFGQQLTEYTLPWDQAGQAAALAGDRYTPSMPGFSGASGYNPTDIVGGANANYQAKMGRYNSNQSGWGQAIGAGLEAYKIFSGFGGAGA